MNRTLMFIQADMHRAINEGRRTFEVSVMDMKELLGAVESASARERCEKLGILTGFIRDKSLSEIRSGKSLYCTIRRKKNEEYCLPIYSDPIDRKTVDAIAQTEDNPTHSSD